MECGPYQVLKITEWFHVTTVLGNNNIEIKHCYAMHQCVCEVLITNRNTFLSQWARSSHIKCGKTIYYVDPNHCADSSLISVWDFAGQLQCSAETTATSLLTQWFYAAHSIVSNTLRKKCSSRIFNPLTSTLAVMCWKVPLNNYKTPYPNCQ